MLRDEWDVTNKVHKSSDENNNYDYSFITYEKNKFLIDNNKK